MALCSHNKHHHSAHTRQFVSKYIIMNDTSSSSSHTLSIISFSAESSHIDRFISADDSELNVESLIENLEDVIVKKLLMPCVARSPASLSAPSAAASQSPTPAPVSGSPAPATPVPVTLTSATPGFAASAFVTSSPHFKKMLYRLNESCLSV
ncbi:hypothetical protein BDFG_06382, partial [Blastomyces dermatitidis ATCC 26199]